MIQPLRHWQRAGKCLQVQFRQSGKRRFSSFNSIALTCEQIIKAYFSRAKLALRVLNAKLMARRSHSQAHKCRFYCINSVIYVLKIRRVSETHVRTERGNPFYLYIQSALPRSRNCGGNVDLRRSLQWN
jgi:hypothetical protein